MVNKAIVDQFHKLYTDLHICHDKTFWLGVPIVKVPLDCWVYQEIIFEVRPDLIIESGTGNGGSALFFASICDLINNGRVVTIDIEARVTHRHERIDYLLGSSISLKIVNQVRSLISDKDRVMVDLDSAHDKSHVLKELTIYSEFVSVGSYLIVEDTNINGHPILPAFGPGPAEAVQEFLSENENFIIDKTKEKFLFTFNPSGYLKKVK